MVCHKVPYYLLPYIIFFTSDAPKGGECKLVEVVCGKLQRQLDTLSDYFKNWKIRLNPTKIQAIYFTRCTSLRNLPASCIKLNGQEIPWSPEVKYLGLSLDKRLTLVSHIAKSTDGAKKAFRILYSFLSRRSKYQL
jgi:hypothetical protein